MEPCARNSCPGANAEAPPPRASAVDEAARSKPATAASIVILVIVSSSISFLPSPRRPSRAVRGNYENAGDVGLFNKAKRRAAQHVRGIGQVPLERVAEEFAVAGAAHEA
jgi:hypothetical protein